MSGAEPGSMVAGARSMLGHEVSRFKLYILNDFVLFSELLYHFFIFFICINFSSLVRLNSSINFDKILQLIS